MFSCSRILLFFYLFLFGCISVQNNLDINKRVDIPTVWQGKIEIDSTITNEWWKEFEDTDLDSLIILFLNNNYNLKSSYSSLESAFYRSQVNGTDIFPSITSNLSKNEGVQNYKEELDFYMGSEY